MKIPFCKIERAVRMLPIIKEVFAPSNTEDPKTNKLLSDALHDKKAEICKLRERIKDLEKHVWDLEENLENTSWMLTKKQEELDGERR